MISPDGKTENKIDHVCVSKQRRISVSDTRAMRGANASSGHELMRSKITLKLKKQKHNANTRSKKIDFTKLQQPEVKRAFTIELK